MAMHLKAARVNAGLTQDAALTLLNEATGKNIATSTLIAWEKEERFPPVPVFKALCNIYGCSMNDIFVPESLT